MIFTQNIVTAHFFRKRTMGLIVLGHHQKAAGVLVDAMHDARADHTANAGKPAAAVIQKRIHHRAVRVAGRRMHHHALGLVDHQQMFVFIYDGQRNVLRHCLGRGCIGNFHLQHIPGLQLFFFARRFSVAQHPPCLDQFLQGAARKLAAHPGQGFVQSLALVFGGGRVLKAFHFYFPRCPAAHPGSEGPRPHTRRYPQN